MDENIMRVLKMLQEGSISAQDAEMLISALRGESRGGTATPPPPPPQPPTPPEAPDEKGLFGGFDRLKPPKLDLDDLGTRISQAVSKVQPDKIVRRVQSQIRNATRAGAHWGSSFQTRLKTWAEGEDRRPEKPENWHEVRQEQENAYHLEPNASLFIENALGNVRVVGVEGETATLKIVKQVWHPHAESLEAAAREIEIVVNATESRLDVKVNAPANFFEGVVDIEAQVPRFVNVRVATHHGNAHLSHIDGRAEAVTTVGDLHCDTLGGDVRGETLSGGISLQHIVGSASVASQSGDIHAEDVLCGISANALSGDVRIQNIEGGRVECKSVSGDASAVRIGLLAPLDIVVESVSGDASLKEAWGNIALKAVSGDASAEQIRATNLQAQTVSGDVSLKLSEAFCGVMQVNTVSGGVHIGLPEGSNVRVSLGTNSGDLHCDQGIQKSSSSDTFWTGQAGTGAGTVNVQTISGDIHIDRA